MFQSKAKKSSRAFLHALMLTTLTLVGASDAFALPSFARQTGESCDACHVGSFGPQLTPHGMKFKIGGYTESDGKPGHIPLAAMLIETYTHTSADLPEAPKFFSTNNNTAMQELSAFLAGKWFDNVGSFAQVTFSGVEKKTSLDNVDIRYASDKLLGEGATFGVSLNNSPGFQDPFNTLPGFRFPYTSSDFGASPGVTVLLDDFVAGQVFGASAYAQLANGVYAEFGGYHALSKGFLDKVNLGADNEVRGIAPYARLAYFKDMKSEAFSVGLVGMSAKTREGYDSANSAEKRTDIGVDAHYQLLGNRMNIWSVNGAYIHENGPENANQFNVAGSYYFDKTYGATVRYFSVTGKLDDGTETGTMVNGDSRGLQFQADWTPFGKESSWNAPWANLRLGLQYTMFNKLDGESASDSKDANTLMVFAWLSL